MKLNERIALLKAGYTKEEISELIREDQEAADIDNKPEDSPAADSYMEVIKALATEVQGLKNAMHASNQQDVEVKKEPQRKAEDILKELFEAPPKDKEK